jgi:ornithine decarboxylase
VELIHQLFGKAAGQFFNNPAKTRPAIRRASADFDVQSYTVDCLEEVEKILEETDSRGDLLIAVRLATAPRDARYVLSTKYGAEPHDAVKMLQFIHRSGARAGVSFHVGSQCIAPQAYTAALALVQKVIYRAGIPISILNVGGGFPVAYPGEEVPTIDYYFSRIIEATRALQLPTSCLLFCEPGRSLVATSGTVVLQVMSRRGKAIIVNDGVFGTLQELGHPKERRPTKHHRKGPPPSSRVMPFKVFGPTCDSNDALAAPFLLPEDVREGDWIEVQMMGAYSLAMRTRFNGFHADNIVAIES